MDHPIDPEIEPAGDRIPENPDRSETETPAGPAPDRVEAPGHDADSSPPAVRWILRHRLPVRLSHWVNVLCLPILVMSGLQIFNAHPALYLGERSDRDRPILALNAARSGSGEIRGITTVLGISFDTTGWLGASGDSNGRIRRRGFPSWATIPSHQWLAMGRRWHFFFAWIFVLNGIFFAGYALISRHLDRDLLPSGKDLRGLGRALADHLLFRRPGGESPGRYNVLQRIAYTGVVFGSGPLIVLTGLTMSPGMDAAFPWLLTVFGGRQSARTLHFIVCFSFIGFFGIHLFMVAVTGLWNNLRSMVLGRYRIAGFGAERHDR